MTRLEGATYLGRCEAGAFRVPVIGLRLSAEQLGSFRVILNTVHMLIMHIVIMHKSHNASTFEDPDVVPN
jgi:hypothetical protein